MLSSEKRKQEAAASSTQKRRNCASQTRRGLRRSFTSLIADARAELAAKNPIRPRRVHEDDRQQERRADQQKHLRAGRRRGLPQREVTGHHVRKQADGNAKIRY